MFTVILLLLTKTVNTSSNRMASNTCYKSCMTDVRGSLHTIKKNAEDLVVASREIGLEVNADKTKYMVMSCDQNAE